MQDKIKEVLAALDVVKQYCINQRCSECQIGGVCGTYLTTPAKWELKDDDGEEVRPQLPMIPADCEN